ncbi:MAG TPA: TlpA disulfide reductase family protein [Verrucomicrobiae bacterium]
MGTTRALLSWVLLGVLTITSAPHIIAAETTPDDDLTSPENKSFNAIRESLSKTHAGRDKPTEADFATRRAAGAETAANAKKFLQDFPNSKQAGEANSLWNYGLYKAALAGDTNSAGALKQRQVEILADPKADHDLQENVVVWNYQADWAAKNGKRELDASTLEGRLLWGDALFAAADIVPNKIATLQTIVLLARSTIDKFTDDQRRDLAQRVIKHPGANQFLKTEAQKVLSGKPPFEIGKPIDLKFTAMDGREVDLAKLRGKVVLIDFWATWCGPCVAEFPHIKKTYEKFHDKGLEIIGISLDDDKQDLLNFLKKNGPAPWPQYFDGKGWNTEMSFKFAINAVPTYFLIDKKGNLVSTNPSTLAEDNTIDVEGYLEQ